MQTMTINKFKIPQSTTSTATIIYWHLYVLAIGFFIGQ